MSIHTREKQINYTKYYSFYHGWMDGAAAKPQNELSDNSQPDYVRESYTAGYIAGQIARRKMSVKAAKQYSYKPTILRALKTE